MKGYDISKLSEEKIRELERFAVRIRIGIVDAIESSGSGHIGGSLSIADAVAVLYGAVMRVDPNDPKWPDRDKLVCSKGHCGPALYAALALKGFFPYEELRTLNDPHTRLPSHCDRNKTPGIDATTGSLGQGASMAVGMALGDRIKGRDTRVFLITGDGELNEGQTWEAAMFAAGKNIDNLVWLVDFNKKQLDGATADVLALGDLEGKFRAFGFDACTVDGADIGAVYDAVTKKSDGRPIAVILDTLKGRGIRDVENTENNHSMSVPREKAEKWRGELMAELSRC